MKKAVGYLLFSGILCFSNLAQAQNWHKITQGLNFSKMVFADSLLGWAISNVQNINGAYTFDNDCIYKTTNGGKVWTICRNFTTDVEYQYNYDLVYKDGNLYNAYNSVPFDYVGNVSYVECSTDFGVTWQGLVYDTNVFICKKVHISVIDSLSIWGASGTIWKWNNTLQNWDSIGFVNIADWEEQEIELGDNLNGFVASLYDGLFYKTNDGGHNWDSLTCLDSITDFICRTPSKIWAICGSKVNFSSDSGKTWQEQNTGLSEKINCIFALNDSVLWAGADNGLVVQTKNGGTTWLKDSVNSSQRVNSIFFTGDSFGWAATADSVLWGFGRAGLGVEGNSPENVVTTNKIFLTASPNPFKQKTAIAFEQNSTGFVNVSIYSITGQLVKTLVDGIKEAGNYQISWNGRDSRNQQASQGVYICQMKNANHLATKKIVLLR